MSRISEKRKNKENVSNVHNSHGGGTHMHQFFKILETKKTRLSQGEIIPRPPTLMCMNEREKRG